MPEQLTHVLVPHPFVPHPPGGVRSAHEFRHLPGTGVQGLRIDQVAKLRLIVETAEEVWG